VAEIVMLQLWNRSIVCDQKISISHASKNEAGTDRLQIASVIRCQTGLAKNQNCITGQTVRERRTHLGLPGKI
jgi:hypothetical protein